MTLPWHARLTFAALAAAAVCTAPALARDKAKSPTLTLEPIVARNLLAPVDDKSATPAYRLDPSLDAAAGQRARFSIPLGDSTLFAITGKLNRRPDTLGPLDERHAKALGHRRTDSKVYGAGIERSLGVVDLSATYQYSKLRAEQPQFEGQSRPDGLGRSHSVRATARIRFRN